MTDGLRLGTNLFLDCERVLVIDGRTTFAIRVGDTGLSVDFDVPAPPASQSVRVVANEVESGRVRVESTGEETSVLQESDILLGARRTSEGLDVVLDLRPLGLKVFADASGLHIGTSVLSHSAFKRRPASSSACSR